jgi:cytochrome c peroxidase
MRVTPPSQRTQMNQGALPRARVLLCSVILMAFVGPSCATSAKRKSANSEGLSPQGRTELTQLGRRLFGDIRLSRDSTISCATCHNPDHGFAEPRPESRGIGANSPRRNAQSLLDVGRQHLLTWDGRLRTLEQQVHEAFTVEGDMGISLEEAAERVRTDAGYTTQFRRALNSQPNAVGIAAAIAEFERTLSSGLSRFDCFLFFKDSTALSASELRGWNLFVSARAGCAGCHSPIERDPPGLGRTWFSDRRYHNLGVGFAQGSMSDSGRFGVTRNADHFGAFRTPSLVNVAMTPPYMHDGSLPTLEAVVEFYSIGGVPNPGLDAVMIPRAFTQAEREDLVSFLRSLTSISTVREPNSARSAVQSARRSTFYGQDAYATTCTKSRNN